MAADWSELPSEVLQLISEKLNNTEIYLIRFRSVCSTWRRSCSIPNHPQNSDDFHSVRYISKQYFFLIKPPHNHKQQTPLHPWLMRIGPDLNGETHLWYPFDYHVGYPLYFTHHLIDFNQLPVLHLGQLFYLQIHYRKVVVARSEVGQQPLGLLTYNTSDVPKIFRCEDGSCISIPTMLTSSLFGDICLFKGRPCVADKDGRTLMIGSDFNIHLLANPVFGGNVKYLVEIECELLLLDCHGIDTCAADEDIWFDVFKLNENEKKWVKLSNIGDIVLFVEGDCAFSAKASDLQVQNGNSVVYMTAVEFRSIDKMESALRIFHLDQGRVSKLSDYPDYIRLFWPPPEWIIRLHSQPDINKLAKRERKKKKTTKKKMKWSILKKWSSFKKKKKRRV